MADKPKKPENKRDPEKFLLRPDEVAEMRQAAVKGGMSPEEFSQHLEDMRKKLRATGKLNIPPKLKAAITKGSDRSAPKGLQAKVTKRAERRAANRPEPKFVYGKPNPNYRGPGGTQSAKGKKGKPKVKVVNKGGKLQAISAVDALQQKLGR